MSFVLSYGTGAFGRLGLGSLTQDQPTPRFIDLIPQTGNEIACISAGLYHSAIVTKNRRVLLTGMNATGCLAEVKRCGEFRLVESLHPRHDILQVSCGGDLLGAHTLAVSRSGRLYAWGMTRACGLGPLEDEVVARPTLVTEFARNDLLNPNSDQEIVALERVAFATAGGSCSAIITTEGSLFTFGITAGGRLGHDRKRSVEWRPKRVDSLLGETVVAVSAGGSHMLCVTERGALYAWGDNGRGQVGTGDLTDRFRPVRIPHPSNSAWAPIIAAGEGHSMAVDVNGRLFTWGGCGGPMLGRAGIGNSVSAEAGERERALSISFKLTDVCSDYTKPRLVSCLSDYRIVRIGAGARHSVAVTSEGLVYSWGSKAQVGIPGHHQLVTVPRLVCLPTTRIGAVSCGSYHTMIVTDESTQSPVLQYIAATMMNRKPSPLTHDCFISTIDGTKVWLNAAVLKSRLNYVGFNSFIKPQLEMVDSDSPPSQKDSLSLGRLAEEFRFTQTAEEKIDCEYDRLGKIIGDWIITSDNPGNSSEIPDDCLFANLSRIEAVKFFTFLFLDELPHDIDDAMRNTLLKLSICSQFERGVFLLTPTTTTDNDSREINIYPTSSVAASMDELYRQRDSSGTNIVKIQCGLPIYRDTVTEDSDLQIPIHGFVLEAMITAVSERNRFLSSSRDVPVDVMDELVFVWYHFHLNRNELEAEIDLSQVFDSDESKAIAFWNRLLGVALACGSRYAAAAARDHLVSMISDSNWISMMASEARESAMCVAQEVLTKKVLSHSSFAQASGYIHSETELPGVVERILSADSQQLDGEEELKQRVLKQVSGHCSVARKIQSKLEYYQTMNLEPMNAKSSVKSMFVSIRNGPSLAAAGRDLVMAVAIIAAFGWLWTSSSATATESTRLGSFMSNNSLLVQVFIVGVNFALLTATVFFFQRFSHKNPPKITS